MLARCEQLMAFEAGEFGAGNRRGDKAACALRNTLVAATVLHENRHRWICETVAHVDTRERVERSCRIFRRGRLPLEAFKQGELIARCGRHEIS